MNWSLYKSITAIPIPCGFSWFIKVPAFGSAPSFTDFVSGIHYIIKLPVDALSRKSINVLKNWKYAKKKKKKLYEDITFLRFQWTINLNLNISILFCLRRSGTILSLLKILFSGAAAQNFIKDGSFFFSSWISW